jgi:hypothetical protein
MKKLISFLVVLILLASCKDDEPECICTTEFRILTVTVVDSLDHPVDSLLVNITDEFGRTIKPLYKQLSYQPGLYVVVDDSYVDNLSTEPLLIYFTASDSIGRTANTIFIVNTDDCQCHVQKISGPTKIELK